MRDLESRLNVWPAVRVSWFVLSLMASVVLLMAPPGLVAQETPEDPAATEVEQPEENGAPEQAAEDSAPEQADEVTEVDRILRITRVIELDEERLIELREEMVEKDDLLASLAAGVQETADELVERKVELEQLGTAGDPSERRLFELKVEWLEADLDLFKTQADLEYKNTQAHRESITALEKKLEREQRALDYLRGEGGKPTQPATREPAATSQTSTETPGALAIPGMPPIPTPAAPASPAAEGVPETATLIAARRKVERRREAIEEAEYALVEFVKRKESLEYQIKNERTLIGTVEGSQANLERAISVYQGNLEEARETGAAPSDIKEFERRIGRVQSYLEATILEIEKRRVYIASLEDRLGNLVLEEKPLSRAVEEAREKEEAAVRAIGWIQSPLHPANLSRWFHERGPRMLLVLVAVIALLVFVRLSVRRVARLAVRKGRGRRSSHATNRADTMAFSFKSAASMLIVIFGVLLILQEAGVDIKTVLGGAAIFGVAVAFGAQNLMRDYFTGFMILLEDQYELGDLVTIDNITGRVEKVNMRTTMLRDIEGRVHFIPNGNVRSVTNRTYEWGRAVLEVPVSFQENVDRVMAVLMQVAQELRDDPEFEGWVTDDPTMLGVDKFTESGAIVKFMVQTQTDKIFPTRRELLRRVKNRFDEEGIEISVPYRRVLSSPVGESD